MRFTIVFLFVLSGLTSVGQTIDNAYKNFDFVAGEKTLFDDNLQHDLKDKANQKWILGEGDASIIDFEGQKCISIDAYYTKLTPILFGLKTLPDSISIEYDTWLDQGYDGNPGVEIHLRNEEKLVVITPNKHALSVFFPGDGSESKDNPSEYFGESKFYNRWVHISIAQFKTHLSIYLDQYKMMDIPDCRLQPKSVMVTGNTSQNMKILFKNFRIATHFPQKITFQNNKFITHPIKFELKPESITMIKQLHEYLVQHKSERFEISGHTDNDGSEQYNVKLSQSRAEAVKNQLVSMGIDKARLEAKGYGQAKPIDPKNTPQAKANNRRVEFTKL